MAITLALAKAHLEVQATDWDTLIQSYTDASADQIESITGNALSRAERELTFGGFPEKDTPLRLGVGPDVDVSEVAYVDDEGNDQTLTGWVSYGQVVRPATVWPTNARTVTVTATYGYATVPDAIIQAQLLTIGQWFADREAGDMPAGAMALLSNKRVFAFPMRSLKSGQLDRIITLRQPTRGTHNGFTKTDTYADAGTRHAALMPQGPRETMETWQRVSNLSQRFKVRSDSLTRQITPTWKLVYSDATYDIIGVTEDGRRDGLVIEAVASDRGD